MDLPRLQPIRLRAVSVGNRRRVLQFAEFAPVLHPQWNFDPRNHHRLQEAALAACDWSIDHAVIARR